MFYRVSFVDNEVVEAGDPSGTGNLRDDSVEVADLGFVDNFAVEQGSEDGFVYEFFTLL